MSIKDLEEDIEFLEKERKWLCSELENVRHEIFWELSNTRYMPGNVGSELVKPKREKEKEICDRIGMCEKLIAKKTAQMKWESSGGHGV